MIGWRCIVPPKLARPSELLKSKPHGLEVERYSTRLIDQIKADPGMPPATVGRCFLQEHLSGM